MRNFRYCCILNGQIYTSKSDQQSGDHQAIRKNIKKRNIAVEMS